MLLGGVIALRPRVVRARPAMPVIGVLASNSPADFEPFVRDRAPAYMVVSLWERSPEWTYQWPERNPDKVSVGTVFYMDAQRKEPGTIVYAIDLAAFGR